MSELRADSTDDERGDESDNWDEFLLDDLSDSLDRVKMLERRRREVASLLLLSSNLESDNEESSDEDEDKKERALSVEADESLENERVCCLGLFFFFIDEVLPPPRWPLFTLVELLIRFMLLVDSELFGLLRLVIFVFSFFFFLFLSFFFR